MKTSSTPMTSITFKMPTEHSNQLKMLASEERVTVSQYVRALINKKLKTQPIKTPRRPGGRYRGQEYSLPPELLHQHVQIVAFLEVLASAVRAANVNGSHLDAIQLQCLISVTYYQVEHLLRSLHALSRTESAPC